MTSKELEIKAYESRRLILDGVHAAKCGHPGGSLSCVDALTVLYFDEMNVDPADPKNPDRDRFVLSKGHCAPALYATLANRGYFPKEDMLLLRSIKAHLSGHPDMVNVPGVEFSTGSLGQGISGAVGMALAAKHTGKTFRTYAVLGDGEIEEGQCWEAFMAAAKWKLDNLCAFIDVNGLQIDGTTADVMPSEPLDKKLEAFNWHVIKINGHDYDAIKAALAEAKTVKGQPTMIIMHTVKGKGVSYMENAVGWHGKAPNDDEYAVAVNDINNHLKELGVEVNG